MYSRGRLWRMKFRESKLRIGWVKMDRHCRGSSSSFEARKQERSWQVE